MANDPPWINLTVRSEKGGPIVERRIFRPNTRDARDAIACAMSHLEHGRTVMMKAEPSDFFESVGKPKTRLRRNSNHVPTGASPIGMRMATC